MGLIARRGEGGAKIPPGEKIRFGIKSAVEDWGQYGPQAKLILEVLGGEHKGSTIQEWASLAQPRLDFVEALRNKDYTDEKIAQILREQGYEFEDIDESEEDLEVPDGGKLYNIAMARFNGNVDLIDSFGSIEELLDALVGGSFVSITKPRGEAGKYVGITWDMVYTDPEANQEDPEEDFDEIPI